MSRRNVFVFSRLLLVFSSLAAAMLFAAPAIGATALYWDTNGTTAGTSGAQPNDQWGGNSYWNSDPTGGGGGTFTKITTATNDLYFVAGPSSTSGTAAFMVSLNGAESEDGLFFQSSGPAGIAPGGISLAGDGITDYQVAYGTVSNGAVTICSSLTLTASQTWTNNSSNPLGVYGPVNINGNGWPSPVPAAYESAAFSRRAASAAAPARLCSDSAALLPPRSPWAAARPSWPPTARQSMCNKPILPATATWGSARRTMRARIGTPLPTQLARTVSLTRSAAPRRLRLRFRRRTTNSRAATAVVRIMPLTFTHIQSQTACQRAERSAV